MHAVILLTSCVIGAWLLCTQALLSLPVTWDLPESSTQALTLRLPTHLKQLQCLQSHRVHHPMPKGFSTNEEDIAFICNHIESFPSYNSHYSRSDNPNRKYLSPDLSLAKIYSLYKIICTKEQVSDWVYHKIFNERYNLCFGMCVKR